MDTKTIQAVIFGATGLAGSGVLDECLKHPRVTKVTVVSRRSTGKRHDKLNEIIHQNFLDYSSIENSLRGHNEIVSKKDFFPSNNYADANNEWGSNRQNERRQTQSSQNCWCLE
jgi:putative NADH-flavin reductase